MCNAEVGEKVTLKMDLLDNDHKVIMPAGTTGEVTSVMPELELLWVLFHGNVESTLTPCNAV